MGPDMGVLRTNENAATDKNFALEESVTSVSGMHLDTVQ
jgi:hypothetical protein